MAEQTAVDWLIKTYLQTKKIDNFDLEVAKVMEKERLEDCWIAAKQSEDLQTFFNYYNETYNK